ncbi:2-hydroxyacid dehydrogenase [Luteolibacter marinus]|uniref:2-hydroxyacid dehydrogenase n=1 Tax=Luteolibacter marinus TaxID=2776705 RepID=UPI001865FE49|nr:2-hydroxyacid dehydrogenase [Luteolibacter marinus]
MKVAVFSTKPHDREYFDAAGSDHEFRYFENRLRAETAGLAKGCQAACVFVNDEVDRDTIRELAAGGVGLIALRCAGFNNVDLAAAADHGVRVMRVPEYSPHAVAEYCLALLLAANRHIHRAYSRVRDGNFELKGLLGFDLHGKTIGVIGTGRIGLIFCKLLSGFGVRVLASDPYPNEAAVAAGASYVPLEQLLAESHVITLHCPLTPATHHLIDDEALSRCRDGVLLVNTSRGGLVDTAAVIRSLKSGKIGGLALDVYEEESGIFFENLSDVVIDDDRLMRLMTFPNVLVTSHQAFFTAEALSNITSVTLDNLDAYERGETDLATEVRS